ncbi:MAG: hypothetical protein Q8942_04075 [Bacillota bacterium]|nr:hypothetical protein [Bacillota bacterium]
MRIVAFKTGKRKDSSQKRISSNTEKIFVITFFFIFAALILSQVILAMPSTRNLLVSDAEYEGSPIGAEESLYSEGELKLELQNMENDNNLNVLVNGDEVAAFSNKSMVLKVKDGDVVEIDGTNSTNSAVVKIIDGSANLKNGCVGREVKVNSDLKNLIKINLE